MTNASDLFPQGHALGKAFCDREEERNDLKNRFLNREHTVLVAPRRYGKSSLIKQVIMDMHIPGNRIDLLPATNARFVQRAIKSSFSEVINEIAPKTKQAKQKLIDLIKSLNPRLTLNVFGQKLEVSAPYSPESSITDLLLGLNVAAKKVNKIIVMCFDEFQQVGALKNHHSIEASIRHAVESSTHITYVFSGSNRHLLSQMFSQKSRPLYSLCDLMELKRIPIAKYLPILGKRAKQQWGTEIDKNTIAAILALTNCHPYYVNALCRQLWKCSDPITYSDVHKTWMTYVANQANWISDDLARLSPHQRNIMAALAYEPTSEISGNDFCTRVRIGESSVRKSLKILLRNDFLYKDIDRLYKVLDPAVQMHIQNIKYFDFLEE